jgi:hypothetical protein
MNPICKIRTGVLLAVSASAIYGCALAPLAVEGTSLVNGSTSSKISVVFDENTFTPKLRDALLHANHWAIAVAGRSDIKMADALESRGGFKISVDRPTAKPGEMTNSERRDALRKMCATYKSDISLLPRVDKMEQGNVWAGAFTGRAKVTTNGAYDVLDCRHPATYSFNFAVTVDLGIWTPPNRIALDDEIGNELANRLLIALGKIQNEATNASPTAARPDHG